MFGLQNVYTQFSNTASKNGLKSAHSALSTPPLPFLGKINTSNLAPLNLDTVSFTGKRNRNVNERIFAKNSFGLEQTHAKSSRNSNREKITGLEQDIPEIMESLSGPLNAHKAIRAHRPSPEFFDNSVKNLSDTAKSIYKDMLPFASQIHEDAKELQNLFEVKMCIFDCLLGSNSDRSAKSTKGPLADKTIRVKSTYSIANKLANKFAEMKEMNDYYDVLVTKDIAKSKIHDVLGARLVLQNGQIGEANAVINQLIKSIESGNGPKIKAIKNYGKNCRYLTSGKIEQLEEAIAKAGYKHPEVTDRRKSSGYTATHIIIEVANGIDAEIQILGRGVNRVKHVDDICYKGLQGKYIKGLPSEILKELRRVGQDSELTLYFNRYLSSAYDLAKKEWDKLPDGELERQKFPSINTKVLPACLDLNNIEEELNKNTSAKTAKRR